jgi:hypothetical protein
VNIISQNFPNPFDEITQIDYRLSANITSAFIKVCNLKGKQLKSIKLEQTGNGSISIARGALKPGIYLYTLVANGQMVDTKKMMITE